MLTRRRSAGSFWAPERGERAGWAPPLQALDSTLTPFSQVIAEAINRDACRTADPEFNSRCLIPARLSALKRLAQGEAPPRWAGETGDAETSAAAQAALAVALVREAGLDAWTFDPSVYQEGGAFWPEVIGASVPGAGSMGGAGVVNVRILPGGLYEQPAELTARAQAAAACDDIAERMARRLPWEPVDAALEEALAECWAAVDAMPYPPSVEVPGIRWTPPAPPEPREIPPERVDRQGPPDVRTEPIQAPPEPRDVWDEPETVEVLEDEAASTRRTVGGRGRVAWIAGGIVGGLVILGGIVYAVTRG